MPNIEWSGWQLEEDLNLLRGEWRITARLPIYMDPDSEEYWLERAKLEGREDFIRGLMSYLREHIK